jgi:hypothetical protein
LAARRPPEAVAAFLAAVRRVLSCVTEAVPNNFGGYQPSPRPHQVLLGRGCPVPLRGIHDLAMSLAIDYRIAPRATEHSG